MRYVFADCELDTEHYRLYRAGCRMPLRPTAFQLLTYLVEHRDRVISKQELCEQVWQTHIVSDATLENCVKTVRQAVGDSGRAQQVIRTWYGHGYRFVAPVGVPCPSERGVAAVAPAQSRLDNVMTTALATVHDCVLSLPSLVTPAPGSSASLAPAGLGAEAVGNDVRERKIVTVLCGALAPPPARDMPLTHTVLSRQIPTLSDLVSPDIHTYGGTVQVCSGAYILAVFGAPLAQEDHAQRAVIAALALLQRLSAAGSSLMVRLGVHTGVITVGAAGAILGATETTLEETVTLAVALQARAIPGTILCSAVTAALVRRIVRLKVIQASAMAGHAPPGSLYQVESCGTRRGVLVSHSTWRRRAFVGRTREGATLHALWTHVTMGHGQVVSVVGAPGMGKSRLVDAFRRSLAGQPHLYLQGRCVSYGQVIPYLPVLDLLRQACGIGAADRPPAVTAKVSRLLQTLGIEPATAAPYLSRLLGGHVEPACFAGLPAEVLKAHTIASLGQLCISGSRQRPLVLEIEDLHWLDAASEAILAALVEQCAGLPILLLVTTRPGYRLPWMEKSYATQIALTQLSPAESQQVVESCLAGAPVAEALLQQIVAQAEGNPFFLEELARTIVEHGAQPPLCTVPDTIYAVLTARLDRLPFMTRRVLQAAAVIGREIPLALLAAITALSPTELAQCLAHLQSAEFLRVTHLVPEPVYTFTHVLTQDATLHTLLPATLRHYHQQVAHLLTTHYPDTAAQQPALIAHHYTAAGDNESASLWWQQAGQRALEHSNYREAVQHCSKGLELLATLPNTPARLPLDLELTITLGHALRLHQGNAAPEVGQTFAQAYQLCQQVGEPRHLGSVLGGLRRHALNRGALRTAQQFGEQLLHLAQRTQDAHLLQEAHYSLGITLSFLGEEATARAHLECGMVLVDQRQSRSVHWGLLCRILLALTLWRLGYPEQALVHAHEAVTRARDLSLPVTLLKVLFYAARLHQCRREGAVAQAQTEEVIALATTWGLPQWLTSARILRGWALTRQGQAEAGIVQMQQSLAFQQAIRLKLPTNLVLLAEAYGQVGQPQEGLQLLAEGLAAVSNNGGHWCEAELYRLQGELLLKQESILLPQAPGPRVEQAERMLLQALAVARRQQAKAWELRAAMSLSRLWQQQGKGTRAREILAPVYGWFTEGFDTADLQEARALLAELA